MKIGIFDSGVGGLSIFKSVVKQLPQYDYIYLADSARSPYGNHSHEIIFQYVKQAVDFLFAQDCQLVILACNSASAQSLRRIQQEWLPENYSDRRVLGIIRPIAESVESMAKEKKIGVIGTRATISSDVYKTEIEKIAGQECNIIQKACPMLVPLIEEGFSKRPEMTKMLRYYLRPLKQAGVQVLINGCSHYQLVHSAIQKIMGKNVQVLDTADAVADSLQDYLARHPEIESKLEKNSDIKFLTTDLHNQFNSLAPVFWGEGVKAEKVELSK